MGIFDFLKGENNEEDTLSKEKFIELSTGLDDFEDPSWAQVESALKDVDESEDSFATLSFNHYGLAIDAIQCAMVDGEYVFEALPAQESEEFGKIYHRDDLTYEEVLERFKLFYEEQKVKDYHTFEEDSFNS